MSNPTTTTLQSWSNNLLFNMICVSTENDKFATSHSITLGVNGSSLETAYNIMHNDKKVTYLKSKGYEFNPSKSGDKIIYKITKLYSYDTDAEFDKRLNGADLTKCDSASLIYVKKIFGDGELVKDRVTQTRMIKEELGLVKKSEAKSKANDEGFATAARGMMQIGMLNPSTNKPFKSLDEAVNMLKNANAIQENNKSN